jgi:hypothetical protein
MTFNKWGDDEDRLRNERRGPSRAEMEADLQRAVLNTGGKPVTGKKAAAIQIGEMLKAPTQIRPIGKVEIAVRPTLAPAPKPVVSERRRKHEDLKSEGLRGIDVASLTPVEAETVLGEKPRMAWIALASLRIDDRYQRNVLEVGLRNVYHIARHFDWRKFAPVIVAEIGDEFAVVDGQHRCYAAALRGIKDVPCLVIRPRSPSRPRPSLPSTARSPGSASFTCTPPPSPPASLTPQRSTRPAMPPASTSAATRSLKTRCSRARRWRSARCGNASSRRAPMRCAWRFAASWRPMPRMPVRCVRR